jgi:hypothetical protein
MPYRVLSCENESTVIISLVANLNIIRRIYIYIGYKGKGLLSNMETDT